MSRGIFFSDYELGHVYTTVRRTVTEADVVMFAGLSGDFNPLHTDQVFAEQTPFGQRVAHGMLSASISTGLAQTLGIFEGTTLALMEQVFRYKAPVFFGLVLWSGIPWSTGVALRRIHGALLPGVVGRPLVG